MIKWFAAFMGYYFLRFPGAILGFFVGSFIDQMNKGAQFSYSIGRNRMQPEVFELNLLALAATVIKADGNVKAQELQYVRNFFITNYGEMKASSIFKTFNEQIKKETQNIRDLTRVILERTRYETRLQVLHFLFGVANADGSISVEELNKINFIAEALGIRFSDIESIKAMFVKSADNAYKILEIVPQASDGEVKKAYRDMAKKYHPDKLQSKDPALIKGAQEKFQEVQKAYETIRKARGIN
tara:strand:- start:1948 stop:2673 length:726 start_codon:yes stop_codon:yes gene_type:complete